MFKPQIALLITALACSSVLAAPPVRKFKVLKAKGYDYQYLFCRGSGHGVGNAQAQFLPHALEWVWKGYAPNPDK